MAKMGRSGVLALVGLCLDATSHDVYLGVIKIKITHFV